LDSRAQLEPWHGLIDNGPNWSNAKQRIRKLLVTN
jgi:hypothetical protein